MRTRLAGGIHGFPILCPVSPSHVRENILFGLKVRRVPKARQQKRLAEAARMVGLQDLLDRRPSQLSGGQRQRAALARAIVSRRRVCLMDEPLSNLDAKLRAEMRGEIHRLQKEIGLTMIYVTHDQVEAMTMADQVILLNSGRVEQTGPPHSLYDHPETTFVARFMGSPPMNLLRLSCQQAAAALAETPSDREMETFRRHQGIVGVRPEHVCIGDTGLPARIVAIDYLGSETIVRLLLDDQVLFARIGKMSLPYPEARVNVSWPKAAVYLFGKTGKRLSSEDVL